MPTTYKAIHTPNEEQTRYFNILTTKTARFYDHPMINLSRESSFVENISQLLEKKRLRELAGPPAWWVGAQVFVTCSLFLATILYLLLVLFRPGTPGSYLYLMIAIAGLFYLYKFAREGWTIYQESSRWNLLISNPSVFEILEGQIRDAPITPPGRLSGTQTTIQTIHWKNGSFSCEVEGIAAGSELSKWALPIQVYLAKRTNKEELPMIIGLSKTDSNPKKKSPA